MGTLFAAGVAAWVLFKPEKEDRFTRVMTLGQGHLQRGDGTNAIQAYAEAVALAPESLDAWLNLANAYLLAGNPEEVIKNAREALSLDPLSPAAHYLMGCAYLRLNQPEPALQAFQESQRIDPAVTALDFQLGLAHERLGQYDDAVLRFETVVQFEPDHPSAHYQLSRLYQRAGRAAEAAASLARHQEILARNPGAPSGVAAFERCKYTEPRVAFVLAQPSARGIGVRFVDVSREAFGTNAVRYGAPIAVLDYNHDGRNSLFVREGTHFRVLNNEGGTFAPRGEGFPAATNATFTRCLVGDLNNDRYEDVLVLSEQGVQAFRFATNGAARDATAASGLRGAKARDGVLADLDFTGRLDFLAILPGGQGLQVHRNLGNFYFQDQTAASGLPAEASGLEQAGVEDWNHEDVPGVFLTRNGQPPMFFPKQRAGRFFETNSAAGWPVASAIAFGDFDNDLRADVALAGESGLTVVLRTADGTPGTGRLTYPLPKMRAEKVVPVDYDNDGWEDLLVYGAGGEESRDATRPGLRMFRNQGKRGFEDVTRALGLDENAAVADLAVADFDLDGDTDIAAVTPAGLHLWRNNGGNANRQLKVQLLGNRSNSSGLGVRLELAGEQWHTVRTVHRLPIEIGVGKSEKLDLLKTRWFDLATTIVEVPVQPTQALALVELTLPTGSCPYLYAWDGSRFRFITDILGAAPLGLPVSPARYVEADPEEYLALGGEEDFVPRMGKYELRITEELREVLYLDCAKLVVVDHPAGTVVHPTSKMMPGRPFVPHALRTLRPLASVRRATRSDGADLTDVLRAVDRKMAGPVAIREPQLRGLAHPFWMDLEFDALPTSEPLVLVLNGWLRFGGGMANIAGSTDPSLPFPFPSLEVEGADGQWQKVDVVMGVPAGKTKTILVDLQGKLPSGARRLRISAAFELYFDCISLAIPSGEEQTRRIELLPDKAEMRWHGYGKFIDQPDYLPLTPDYERTEDAPPWRRTPAGWCTRYGDVRELLLKKDDALALLNGGDEVTLEFAAGSLRPVASGFTRSFFVYAVGWDKDADFHVGQGWRVEPLPFAGMDDQSYDRLERPAHLDGAWIRKYNTRYVGALVPTYLNTRKTVPTMAVGSAAPRNR